MPIDQEKMLATLRELADANRNADGTGPGSAIDDLLELYSRPLAWVLGIDPAADSVLVARLHVDTHPDMETTARLHNQGFDAAMAQVLADDPGAADDWLAAHDRIVEINASRACIEWLSNTVGQHGLAAELDDYLAEAFGHPTTDELRLADEARASATESDDERTREIFPGVFDALDRLTIRTTPAEGATP